MNKKLINEINRIHELLFQKQQLNEAIGQLTTAAVRTAIKNTIKGVLKNIFKNNIDAVLKKSPKSLEQLMSMDDLFKTSKDEIIAALKQADPKIAKMDPVQLGMAARTHFKDLVKDESSVIAKELVDDLGKAGVPVKSGTLVSKTGGALVKSAPPIKIPGPGDFISSAQFSDDIIDWTKVTNGKSMAEYNKVISDAIRRSDYSLISKGGFEKYGIPNFREFLEKGINNEKRMMIDPIKGWSFDLKKELPSGLISTSTSSLKKELPNQLSLTSSNVLKKLIGKDTSDFTKIFGKDEIIPKETIELILKNGDDVKKVIQNVTPDSAVVVKNVVQELGDPSKAKSLKSGLMGKANFLFKKSELINSLKSWGVLNAAGKMTNVGWLSLIVLGLGSVAMYGALQETGVDMTGIPNPVDPTLPTDPTGGETGGGGGYSGERKWRSMGRNYDSQILTALGKTGSDTLTDDDIKDIYNKLKAAGKIKG